MTLVHQVKIVYEHILGCILFQIFICYPLLHNYALISQLRLTIP